MPLRGEDVPRHPVRRVEADAGTPLPPDRYPAAIPAVAQVLASIARSRFDLQAVLDSVTESAVRLSGADSGNMALIADGSGWSLWGKAPRRPPAARPPACLGGPLPQAKATKHRIAGDRTVHLE